MSPFSHPPRGAVLAHEAYSEDLSFGLYGAGQTILLISTNDIKGLAFARPFPFGHGRPRRPKVVLTGC
jgi:hypothetical protein